MTSKGAHGSSRKIPREISSSSDEDEDHVEVHNSKPKKVFQYSATPKGQFRYLNFSALADSDSDVNKSGIVSRPQVASTTLEKTGDPFHRVSVNLESTEAKPTPKKGRAGQEEKGPSKRPLGAKSESHLSSRNASGAVKLGKRQTDASPVGRTLKKKPPFTNFKGVPTVQKKLQKDFNGKKKTRPFKKTQDSKPQNPRRPGLNSPSHSQNNLQSPSRNLYNLVSPLRNRDNLQSPPQRDYLQSPPRRDYLPGPPRKDYLQSPPRRDYRQSPARRDDLQNFPRSRSNLQSPSKDNVEKRKITSNMVDKSKTGDGKRIVETTSNRNLARPSTDAETQKNRTAVHKRITKKKRVHQKTLKEIKFYQRTTHLLLRKLAFARLVKELTYNIRPETKGLRWQGTALAALQEAAEIIMVQLFENANKCCHHAGRKTVKTADANLAATLTLTY